jgi:hypothetical protein
METCNVLLKILCLKQRVAVLTTKGDVHYTLTCHESKEGKHRYSSTLSLTSAPDGVGGQRHAPAALSPGKIPVTHCTRRRVVPSAGQDVYGKSHPHRDSIPGQSSR